MFKQDIENKEFLDDHVSKPKWYETWKLQAVLALASLICALSVFGFHGVLVKNMNIAAEEFHTPVFTVLYFLLVAAVLWGAVFFQRKSRKLRGLEQHFATQAQSFNLMSIEKEFIEKELLSHQHRHEAIINAIDHVVFKTDSDGVFKSLNKAWEELTDFDVEGALEHSLVQYVHSSEQAALKKYFDENSKTPFQIYTQIRTKSGSFVAVEIGLSRVALVDDDSVNIIGTIQNVEQRRRAERALGEAEKKYRSIVENAAGGIYQLTPEGLYLSANAAMARILGYKNPDELLREVKNANENVYQDPKKQERFVRELHKTNGVVQHEIQIQRKNGNVIWVSENARAVRDENGELLFIEGSLEDIDERKKAEILIREAKVHSDLANRAKSEFIANMSHELRTPLNAIIGFSEMIHNETYGPLPDPKYIEYAENIRDSGARLLKVINEILDISKIDAGDRHLNDERVDVKVAAQGCLDLLQHKIAASGITVTLSLDDAPQIIAEELAFKQVLMNILSNAVKFTPKDGRITLSHQLDKEGRFHLSVTDTGIGLSGDEIKKALSPFGQVNNEFNRDNSGTGLGLTLVNALLKLHGGTLELFSQKGIGTTATVVMPARRVVNGGVSEIAPRERV